MERFIIFSVWIVVTALVLAISAGTGAAIAMWLEKNFAQVTLENNWITIAWIILAIVCSVLIVLFMFSGNAILLLETCNI